MAQLWADEDYVTFYHLRDVARKYRDLQVFEDGVRRYYCSRHVNVMPNTARKINFVSNYWVPEIAPAWLWVSYRDAEVGCVVHTQPPQVEVAIRNPRGFGVVPKPGWENECVGHGFGKSIIAFVNDFLKRHTPIGYTG